MPHAGSIGDHRLHVQPYHVLQHNCPDIVVAALLVILAVSGAYKEVLLLLELRASAVVHFPRRCSIG